MVVPLLSTRLTEDPEVEEETTVVEEAEIEDAELAEGGGDAVETGAAVGAESPDITQEKKR